jgi:hypothetical protein
MVDLFHSLSTATSLIIQEQDYSSTFGNEFKISKKFQNPLQIPFNIDTQESPLVDHQDRDRWMPFFSGFPTDTIFGASDMNSHPWNQQSIGFFQVGHLLSKLDEFQCIISLSFITRSCLRFCKSQACVPSMYQSIKKEYSIAELHDGLIQWYMNTPSTLILWSLDIIMCPPREMIDTKRLSCNQVLMKLLFFASLSILHQSQDHRSETVYQIGIQNYKSREIIVGCYQGMLALLTRIYGTSAAPTMADIPPYEAVGSPIIATLMMPIITSALSLPDYASLLLAKQSNFQVESLDRFVLPCMDNMGQVWGCAYAHASHLRHIIEKMGTRVRSDTDFDLKLGMTVGNGLGLKDVNSTMYDLPKETKVLFPLQQETEKSWYDLRNEFEDEFLL